MGLNTVKVQGISVTTDDVDSILEFTKKALFPGRASRGKRGQKTPKDITIVTPNPEQVIWAHEHPWYGDVLNSADIHAPDGIGLVLADRISGSGKLSGRIPGVDLMERLVSVAEKEGVSIGLIGGRRGVALKAFECLRQRYPHLKGWAKDGPELSLQDGKPMFAGGEAQGDAYIDKVLRNVRTSQTKYLFIGLGVPKQEWFMERLLLRHRDTPGRFPVAFMVVGGAFDMIAGIVPRAPKFLRAIGLEWLWRLLKEPWRWKRQLVLARFFFNSLVGYRP